MELPIYGDLSTFENNYIKDYEGLNDIEFIDYLKLLKFNYSKELQIEKIFSISVPFNKEDHIIILNAFSHIINFIKVEILEFEIKNKAKPIKTNLSNPEKIAVLYKIGIEETLNKFPITEDKYRFIHELIGGNYDNIKKTMIAGVSNDNIKVAQEFINSKTI